jgi:splicing factor 3B subunit 3
VDVTLVLAVGETVEEVTTTGLIGTLPTLGVNRMFDGSIVQVHDRGVRHIPDGPPVEWRSPQGRSIVLCTLNSRQVVIGLTGGEVIYFEIVNNVLTEIAKKNFASDLTSMSISAIPSGRTRGLFVSISTADKAVRILSLEPDKLLKQVSAQTFPVVAESTQVGSEGYLCVGLVNGTIVRCSMDKTTGALTDARSRFLGPKSVRLERVVFNNTEAILALTNRPWLVQEGGIVPLSYFDSQRDEDTRGESPVVIEYAASFNSEQCPDGFVTVAQNTLRIITCDRRYVFSEKLIPLSYTPRKLVVVPSITGDSSRLAIVESDHNAYTDSERVEICRELGQVHGQDSDWTNVACLGSGKWASCVRLVDPVSLETSFRIEMGNDEVAIAAAVIYFYQLKDNRPCLVVATATGMSIQRRAKWSCLKTYLYDENFIPQLVHVTPLTESEDEGTPLALCQYEGRLLVSLSRGTRVAVIRLYELGKRKLLKKTEYRNSACGGFINIQVFNDRIFAADVGNSIHVLRLNRADGQLHVICDDSIQRYMTCMLVLDYNTVIGADKFDNIFVYRIPSEVREEQSSTGESTLGSGGLRLGPDTAYILGKTHKFDMINSFHLGETVTSMQKVVMSVGASEVILYTTLSGSIGILYPFTSKKEYETFLGLETQIRNDMHASLVGRDHMQFRSYYLPVKGVVDGDLIQSFTNLKNRDELASNLGKTSSELIKMIEAIQDRVT